LVLKIAVCDDVPTERQRLVSLIKAEQPYCEVNSYESGETLLWDFENGTCFDIFFLDIFMSGMNGVEAARRIRTANPDAILVFVSSSEDFYRDSYDLYAFNYLIKPLTQDKLTEVLRRAVDHLNMDEEQVIHISFNNTLYTVRCSQLLYLSSDHHIVNFYLKSGEILKSYGKLDDFVTQLSADFFVRCHQSYIVNLKHVTGMTAGEFVLGEIRAPVSKSYFEQASKKYRLQIFGVF